MVLSIANFQGSVASVILMLLLSKVKIYVGFFFIFLCSCGDVLMCAMPSVTSLLCFLFCFVLLMQFRMVTGCHSVTKVPVPGNLLDPKSHSEFCKGHLMWTKGTSWLSC